MARVVSRRVCLAAQFEGGRYWCPRPGDRAVVLIAGEVHQGTVTEVARDCRTVTVTTADRRLAVRLRSVISLTPPATPETLDA